MVSIYSGMEILQLQDEALSLWPLNELKKSSNEDELNGNQW